MGSGRRRGAGPFLVKSGGLEELEVRKVPSWEICQKWLPGCHMQEI